MRNVRAMDTPSPNFNVRGQSARQARKDKVSGVLMDAGLSRWLLALGNFQRLTAS